MTADSLPQGSAPVALELKAESTGPALSPRQLIWRRFRKHRMAMVGLVGLIALFIFIIVGSIVISEDQANQGVLRDRLTPPNAEYWFGTDNNGRNALARIIYGGQISLIIGVLAVTLSVTLGTVIGGTAAYYGGWLDNLLMRFTEAMLSIPSLFLLIVLGKYLGKDLQQITILGRSFSGSVPIVVMVIGFTSWMGLARIVRANVLSLRELDYISAAKALGVSNTRIFFTHLVPNTLGAIIVSATLGLAGAIISEAYVSFLGLGVQPPTASWGNMVTQAISFIQKGSWWLWLFPSLFIVYTILCINLIGDGLRDALDPRTGKHLN
jgi:peptide/nickel transport system permease protein